MPLNRPNRSLMQASLIGTTMNIFQTMNKTIKVGIVKYVNINAPLRFDFSRWTQLLMGFNNPYQIIPVQKLCFLSGQQRTFPRYRRPGGSGKPDSTLLIRIADCLHDINNGPNC